MTRNNLGLAYASAGLIDQAIAEFEHSLAIKPGFADADANLRSMRYRRAR